MQEIILDASQIEVFEHCPYKWYLGYKKHLTPVLTNPALSSGTFYHEVLKYYYSQPLQPSQTRSAAIGPSLAFAQDLIKATCVTEYLKELGVRSVDFPKVKKDPKFHYDRLKQYLISNMCEDDTSEVIACEQGFSSLLYEDGNRRYILEGMIDLISRERFTGLTITDHKTQSRYYDKYEVNHQAMNYLSFTGANYFRYNYIGLQDNEGPNTFRRDIYKPRPGMIEQWRRDVLRTFHEMYSFIQDTRHSTLHIIDLPNGREEAGFEITNETFPRRRASCDTKFGVCQFHKICEEPDGSKYIPAILTAYKEKDIKWKAWS
jgi:hypothetical protein